MKSLVLILSLAVASAIADDIVRKLVEDGEPRYQHVSAPDGNRYLVDLWVKTSDLEEAMRFDPDTSNIYHVFTRANPTVSRPLVSGINSLLVNHTFDATKPTYLLAHGWLQSATAALTSAVVPEILRAADANVIVLDWSRGSDSINYPAVVINTGNSGRAVGRFINWMNQQLNITVSNWNLIGHGLGAHMMGVAGRYVGRGIPYIVGLDPTSLGFAINDDKFRYNDGIYTEVMHTNAGLMGYIGDLGATDFYPNGGISMPGCLTEECDHTRAVFYFAESISSQGFTGTRCSSTVTAMLGNCFLWGNLKMGGLTPKTGQTGIFYLKTNDRPPFARG